MTEPTSKISNAGGEKLPQKRAPRRGLLRRLAGIIGYVLFLLVVVEIALQAFYRVANGTFLFRRDALALYAADPNSVWAVKPNLSFRHRTSEYSVDIFTNSKGFRVSSAHEEYSPHRDPAR